MDDCDIIIEQMCPRCRCCEQLWHECEECGGDGWVESDDWQDFDEEMPCPTCRTEGGWLLCGGHCDETGQHLKRKLCDGCKGERSHDEA